ncbi:MAG: anti-phage deoxyguanosine triphosphatase [Spirochaetaceae bacterium]
MKKFWQDRRSGSLVNRPHNDRDSYERDRARIIHSAAFRRLQSKTQVLGVSDGDFHRTRLTHSMEVAQIGKGIVNQLSGQSEYLPPVDLIEAIGLAHDIGHPPFGHGGELALNTMMREWGGFEGNGQTLRLLSKLEAHTPGYGLNLTRRTMLGVIKYPVSYSLLLKKSVETGKVHPPKCYHDSEIDVVDWILDPFSAEDRELFTSYIAPTTEKVGKTKFHSIDTSVMELADDISYAVHDFEDGVALKLITSDVWAEVEDKVDPLWMKKMGLNSVKEELFNTTVDFHHLRKRAIGGLVHALIISASVVTVPGFQSAILSSNVGLTPEAQVLLNVLKGITTRYIIKSQSGQTIEYKGRHVVSKLFEAFSSDPEMLMPKDFVNVYQSQDTEALRKRVICDYISGMSDAYAGKIYSRLFIPGSGTAFDLL